MLQWLTPSEAAEIRAQITEVEDPLALFESKELYRSVRAKPQLVA